MFHICFCANEPYARYTATLMTSIIHSTDTSKRFIDFFNSAISHGGGNCDLEKRDLCDLRDLDSRDSHNLDSSDSRQSNKCANSNSSNSRESNPPSEINFAFRFANFFAIMR